jgi:hypothetical protein
MRLSSKNGKKWISDSIDKLHAYLDRAPILVSDIVGTENCVDGVYIVHEETKTKLFFPFDYDIEPKIWVHNIKDKLIQFYPKIIENIYEERAATSIEMADFVLNGGKITDVPVLAKDFKYQKLWRIDKVQLYKDIFILQLEGIRNIGETDWDYNITPTQNRFKFQGGCSVMYLTKYRNKDFNNLIDAGEYFFSNSIFIDELIQK